MGHLLTDKKYRTWVHVKANSPFTLFAMELINHIDTYTNHGHLIMHWGEPLSGRQAYCNHRPVKNLRIMEMLQGWVARIFLKQPRHSNGVEDEVHEGRDEKGMLPH